MLRLPGLIDPHVHLREPGAVHKEDWDSGTSAALAGGFTLILAMPNTNPPVCDSESLGSVLEIANTKTHCDFAQYLGASEKNAVAAVELAGQAAGLKMYLDQTYGPLRLKDRSQWIEHFLHWPQNAPLAIHAEGDTLSEVIQIAEQMKRAVHICHVSRRDEILQIHSAKERGVNITCEVTPQHLFLMERDIPVIGAGRAEVRPALASPKDQQALWDNLDVIDCFASDHAPHTLAEKDSTTPPPGFPGLETALPLYLTAVKEGRLTLDDILLRCVTNPRRIFHLPVQTETWIDVDFGTVREIQASEHHSKCGWTPYEGMQVHGQIRRVVLRGMEVFKNGCVLNKPGSGKNVRPVKF